MVGWKATDTEEPSLHMDGFGPRKRECLGDVSIERKAGGTEVLLVQLLFHGPQFWKNGKPTTKGPVHEHGSHPAPFSLCTSFPSYRQTCSSQQPPSLGHPFDPLWYHTFPCLSTHCAESLCPIFPCMFPSSISRDASFKAALDQLGWSGVAQLS